MILILLIDIANWYGYCFMSISCMHSYPPWYSSSTMSSDSSQSGGPPSSSSRPLPPRPSSRLMTRSAFASFTSPSEPTPQSSINRQHQFNVERIYEFEAPQFYDFTKQSDPERGHLDEHWFGIIYFNNWLPFLIIIIDFRFEKEDSFQSWLPFYC